MFCMCFHLEVFSISFQKICNFYSAYGNAKYLKHRIEYVKFLFIASYKVLLLSKTKVQNTKEIVNVLSISISKRNGYISQTRYVFEPHVGKAKICLRVLQSFKMTFQSLVFCVNQKEFHKSQQFQDNH